MVIFIANNYFYLFLLSLQDLEDAEEDEERAGGDEEHVVSVTTSPIRYEYHVLYSCSYQAPVLYFRASTLGSPPATNAND